MFGYKEHEVKISSKELQKLSKRDEKALNFFYRLFNKTEVRNIEQTSAQLDYSDKKHFWQFSYLRKTDTSIAEIFLSC